MMILYIPMIIVILTIQVISVIFERLILLIINSNTKDRYLKTKIMKTHNVHFTGYITNKKRHYDTVPHNIL